MSHSVAIERCRLFCDEKFVPELMVLIAWLRESVGVCVCVWIGSWKSVHTKRRRKSNQFNSCVMRLLFEEWVDEWLVAWERRNGRRTRAGCEPPSLQSVFIRHIRTAKWQRYSGDFRLKNWCHSQQTLSLWIAMCQHMFAQFLNPYLHRCARLDRWFFVVGY